MLNRRIRSYARRHRVREGIRKFSEASDLIRFDLNPDNVRLDITGVYRTKAAAGISDYLRRGEPVSLNEFSDLCQGYAEKSNGVVQYSRDGSNILMELYIPKGNWDALPPMDDPRDNFDYARSVEATVRIIHEDIEPLVDYLDSLL